MFRRRQGMPSLWLPRTTSKGFDPGSVLSDRARKPDNVPGGTAIKNFYWALAFEFSYDAHLVVKVGCVRVRGSNNRPDKHCHWGAIGGQSAGSVTTRIGTPTRYAATSSAIRCHAVRKRCSVT